MSSSRARPQRAVNPITLVTAYLNDHPRPRAQECARACGSDVSVVREVARRLKVPLAAEFDRRRDKEILDRFELFESRKTIDARIVRTHEELLLHFREFAHARGVPWRVAMTEAVEEWMQANRRRPIINGKKEKRAGILVSILLPETIHEGAQLALQRMRS